MKFTCRKSSKGAEYLPKVGRRRWCAQCNTFVNGRNLDRHMLEFHKVGKKADFSCGNCGKNFTRKQALKAHKCRG